MINTLKIVNNEIDKNIDTNNNNIDYYKDNSESGVVNLTEISELQGSLQELNNDKVDNINRTSGIDLRTRLYNSEISSIVIVDALVSLKFLPASIIPFTLQKKRLSVSLNGKGRNEIVDIVKGKRDNDLSSGMGGFSNLFKKKNEMI